MIRARFHANHDDWRPVKWPPPGPCWCTGYAMNGAYSTVVAYVEKEAQIKEYWPEASNIDATEVAGITFTDRFEKPDWWQPQKDGAREPMHDQQRAE